MSEYYIIINAYAVKTAKMTTDKDAYCMLNVSFPGEVLKKNNDLNSVCLLVLKYSELLRCWPMNCCQSFILTHCIHCIHYDDAPIRPNNLCY